MAGLLADGLLAATAARAELERIAKRLGSLELPVNQPLVADELMRTAEAAWLATTQVHRRQVIRVLFQFVTLAHVGHRRSPRIDIRRIEMR